MNDQPNQPTSRNVSGKDIASVLVVLAVLFPLFWLTESGENWAAYLIVLIPIFGLVYWSRIPAKKRAEAEHNAKEELARSALGRGFKYLLWGAYVLVAIVIIKALIEWVQSV